MVGAVIEYFSKTSVACGRNHFPNKIHTEFAVCSNCRFVSGASPASPLFISGAAGPLWVYLCLQHQVTPPWSWCLNSRSPRACDLLPASALSCWSSRGSSSPNIATLSTMYGAWWDAWSLGGYTQVVSGCSAFLVTLSLWNVCPSLSGYCSELLYNEVAPN